MPSAAEKQMFHDGLRAIVIPFYWDLEESKFSVTVYACKLAFERRLSVRQPYTVYLARKNVKVTLSCPIGLLKYIKKYRCFSAKGVNLFAFLRCQPPLFCKQLILSDDIQFVLLHGDYLHCRALPSDSLRALREASLQDFCWLPPRLVHAFVCYDVLTR